MVRGTNGSGGRFAIPSYVDWRFMVFDLLNNFRFFTPGFSGGSVKSMSRKSRPPCIDCSARYRARYCPVVH